MHSHRGARDEGGAKNIRLSAVHSMETGEETGGRDNTAGMDSSTLTGIHIGDTPDIPCREVSVELSRPLKH